MWSVPDFTSSERWVVLRAINRHLKKRCVGRTLRLLKDRKELSMKKTSIIIGSIIVSIICFYIYYISQPPQGIEVKGSLDHVVAWVSLAAAILSLLTVIITLILQAREFKLNKD